MDMTMDFLKKNYSSIKVTLQRSVLTLQMYRPEVNNSINIDLINEMMFVLNEAEPIPEIKVIVLEGLPDFFSTGMDFQVASKAQSITMHPDDFGKYYEILEHFATCSKTIVSKVRGKVNAGGIGFVAASDIVIVDEKATFGLSEALFGLLPACVMPFLIRRIGYQKAQWLTMITQSITAERAFQIGLADELTANIDDSLRRNLLRLSRLDTETIRDLKDYMSKLWIINGQTRTLAINKISAMASSQKIQDNIRNFEQYGKFPWDK
jgi:polyketide biosynthesis enoyl-CoA hydratase PksH